MTEKYKVWCLVEHDRHLFSVSISPADLILDLQDQIYEKRAKYMMDFSCVDIALIKVNVDLRAIPSAAEFQPNADADDDTPLWGGNQVSQVWPTKPRRHFLNVFARLPTKLVFGERVICYYDKLDSVQSFKIVDTSPSQMGQLHEYGPFQLYEDTKILDDRPRQDPVPPASLLYDGFGHFMDDFRRREDAHDLATKRCEVELAVDNFAEEMSSIYNNQAIKKSAGISALNEILSIDNDNELTAADDDCVAHYDGPHDAASCIVVFKSELVDISSIPAVELTSYVARSHAQSRIRFKELYSGWRVPCLGMTIVGPYVTFYAIIFVRQWRVVSLTPALSCIASAGEGDDRKALYAAFYGALALLRRIDEDAARFRSAPPQILHAGPRFPYVSALPKYGGAPDEKVHFRILMTHSDVQDYRHLYFAETLHKKQIMVKFTRRYSIALHEFCADRGHAPGILGFGELPGGWLVIAMDYIFPPMSPIESASFISLLDKWKDELNTLVQSFHDEDLVHGDLRESNIICHEETVVLIGFDWGGIAGQAYYPHPRLCPELRYGRDSSDPKITKDDDKRILQTTLEGFEGRKKSIFRMPLAISGMGG